MDNFLQQYIICALWSSTDDEGRPLDDNYSIEDIAPETLEDMRADCELFKVKASGLYSIDEETRAAHDFWLTRNRHGAGFWDGDWKEPEASQLTAICKEFGEVNLYIGDDGKIYSSATSEATKPPEMDQDTYKSELLADAITIICDLKRGYAERELHRPIEEVVAEIATVLRSEGYDDAGEWDL